MVNRKEHGHKVMPWTHGRPKGTKPQTYTMTLWSTRRNVAKELCHESMVDQKENGRKVMPWLRGRPERIRPQKSTALLLFIFPATFKVNLMNCSWKATKTIYYSLKNIINTSTLFIEKMLVVVYTTFLKKISEMHNQFVRLQQDKMSTVENLNLQEKWRKIRFLNS